MKRWMIILAIPVAALLVGALALKLYFTEDRLRGLVIPAVEEAAGRKAEVGSLSLSFLPSIGVRAGDVRLLNPEGVPFTSPFLLSLKSLFIDLRLLPLFSGRLEIDNLVLERPVVHLDVLADGRKNSTAGGAAARVSGGDAGATEGFSPAALLLSNVEIRDGRIESHNRKLDTRWIVDGLDHRLRVAPSPDGGALLVSGSGEIRGFSYGTGSSWTLEGVPLSAVEELRYTPADDRLEFSDVSLRLRDVPLKVTGSVSDLRQDILRMDLAVDAPGLTVAQLLSLLPAAALKDAGDVNAGGDAAFSLKVSGPSGDEVNPAVAASFTVSNGTIRYPSLTKSITGVHVEGALDVPSAPVTAKGVGELAISRLAATLGANSVSGTLRVSGFGDPLVKATLKGNVALDELREYYPLKPGTALAGSAAGDVSIDGRPSEPRSVRAGGTLRLRGVSWSGPGMARPVRDLTGEIAFNNQSLDLKNLAMAIGSSDLRLNASLKNYLSLVFPPEGASTPKPLLTFDLASKNLNTADLTPPPDSADAGTAADRGGAGGSGAGLLPGIDLSGTVSVETLRTEKFTFTNARGALSSTAGVVKLTGMTLDAFGGTVKTDGTLDLGKPDRRPFDLALDVRGVESNSLLSPFTSFGRFLSGKLTLTTALRGDLDDTLGITPATLAGDGSALIAEGKLTGVPLLQKLSGFLGAERLKEVDFQSWSQSFSIADGRLNIRDLKIGGRDADITVNGTHGLDGGIDYAMHLRLPASVSEGIRLQGVGDQLLRFFKDEEGRLNLDFTVGGDTRAPTLKLDTRAQEEMLKKKLLDDGAKQLGDPLKKAGEGLKKLIKPKP